ncbi:hypothetical protein HNP88_001158 [Methanococcus maripaludis]|uniref:Glycosyl transferase family 10 (Putative fucosyltransferase) n=1 Tax=Methanococcus maripaludis TaxID=39152 RepID=A0A7J9NNE2_METMI|nr:glycosyltransferase family 10 [Methanococcus maripaludis]MBA2846974.1 hypothetical protein [Methanococcus maripaludis]
MDKIKINFTDFYDGFDKEDNFFTNLLSKRYSIGISDNPDYLIYSNFGNDYLNYDCIRIFYTGENIRPNFNRCDYALSFDYMNDHRHYRLPIYRLYGEYDNVLNQNECIDEILKDKLKFCNYIYSNSEALERVHFLKKLSSYKKVDSAGKSMNNVGKPVIDKVKFQKNYKFTIAFENSSYPGYTTEKILHAFAANTIPIYWGNPDITKEFNPNAFVSVHDFDDFDQVIDRIKEIDNNDDLFKKYISASPIFNEKIRNSLTDDNILNFFENIFLTEKFPVAKSLFKYRPHLNDIFLGQGLKVPWYYSYKTFNFYIKYYGLKMFIRRFLLRRL